MSLRTWIFPEHGGVIPGVPGTFHGGLKVVVDEETNTVQSIGVLNPPILPEDSAKVSQTFGEQEIVTPGYKKKKTESSDS